MHNVDVNKNIPIYLHMNTASAMWITFSANHVPKYNHYFRGGQIILLFLTIYNFPAVVFTNSDYRIWESPELRMAVVTNSGDYFSKTVESGECFGYISMVSR